MIIAPSVEITLTFHLILSSWHDCWLLAASELHWQHFILHGIRKSVCYAMSLTKQDIIHLHQHIPALCAGFLVIGLNYAPKHIRL